MNTNLEVGPAQLSGASFLEASVYDPSLTSLGPQPGGGIIDVLLHFLKKFGGGKKKG